MKRITVLLFALFSLHLFSVAQPVLDSSNTCPTVGDVFMMANCNGYVNVGSAGANQTWDLTSFSASTSTTFTGASATGSMFPSSSVKLNSLISKEYYKGSASSLEKSGSENIGSGVVYSYSNTEQLLKFPFHMGDSLSDSWANSFDNGLTYFRQGLSTVLADGYGTVILPNGTFGNVLRVRTIQTYTDSMPGLGIMYSYVNTMYSWYLPGQHLPIASVSSLVTNGSSPVVYGYYLTSSPTFVNNVSKSESTMMTVFPNPAIQEFSVKLSSSVDQPQFSLTDITGREFPLNVFAKTSDEFVIIPSKKLSGIFIVTVKDQGKSVASGKIQFIN